MGIIRVEDIAFVRFQVPDLGIMRRFVQDFGLRVCEASSDRLVSRGLGPAPVLHVAERGERRFAGLGLRAATLADLHLLAKAEGVPVMPLDLPGGGHAVVLRDPDGHQVEVVAGQAPSEVQRVPEAAPWNSAHARARLRQTRRVPGGPAHVLRLGHAVLNVSDFRASEAWYKQRFGLLTSDEISLGPELSLGAFLRCDRGDTPTDHHTLFLLQHPHGPGFNHAAFEVADLDDLMVGHRQLKTAGHTAEWGVGRHILGSQIFDYWRDPWGNLLEHWTDGDLFTASDPSNMATLEDLLGVQWGPDAPQTL